MTLPSGSGQLDRDSIAHLPQRLLIRLPQLHVPVLRLCRSCGDSVCSAVPLWLLFPGRAPFWAVMLIRAGQMSLRRIRGLRPQLQAPLGRLGCCCCCAVRSVARRGLAIHRWHDCSGRGR